MRLDTAEEGLGAIFKEWQTILLGEIFRRQRTYPEEQRLRQMSSRDAHEHLKKLGIKTRPQHANTVSRASVCFFLDALYDAGMMDVEEETGKGGHRRLYEMRLTRGQFDKTVIAKFVQKLMDIFPEHTDNLQPAVDAVVWKDLIA